jgi:hypothetical protein
MKIVIPGGSGQVGAILARAFHHGGLTTVPNENDRYFFYDGIS